MHTSQLVCMYVRLLSAAAADVAWCAEWGPKLARRCLSCWSDAAGWQALRLGVLQQSCQVYGDALTQNPDVEQTMKRSASASKEAIDGSAQLLTLVPVSTCFNRPNHRGYRCNMVSTAPIMACVLLLLSCRPLC
jgi:hypothetical protein